MDMNIDEIIKNIEERTSFDARGGNSICYYIDDFVLLKNSFKEENLKIAIQKLQELKSKGIPVAEIYDYKVTSEPSSLNYTEGYILEEKAKGEPLYKRKRTLSKEEQDNYDVYYAERLNDISNEEQNFYDKFIYDYSAINKSGISVDPSKTDNFFYEKGKQINFIDLTNLSENDKSKDYIGNETFANLINTTYFYNNDYDNNVSNYHDKTEVVLNKVLHGLINNKMMNFNVIKNMYDSFKSTFDIERVFEDVVTKTTEEDLENVVSILKMLKVYKKELTDKEKVVESDSEQEW